jgi:hypothetical protein
MSDKCPTCGQLTVGSSLSDIERALRTYDDNGTGYMWAFWERYSTTTDSEYFVPGLGTVKFLERNYQNESNIYMVWEVRGDYYKVSGWYSSYSDSTWDTFSKVERKTRSAYVYE